MAEDTTSEENFFRTRFRKILPRSGQQYVAIRPQIIRLTRAFRDELAQAVQASLNEHVRAMPHETYEDKKAIAAWLNAELRALGGFSLRCPKSGKPSLLRACPGRHPERGRWRFEMVDDRGILHNFSSSDDLPELILLPESRRAGAQQSRER